MKDRGFYMYETSREMFELQLDCIVTSSIVVDFFFTAATRLYVICLRIWTHSLLFRYFKTFFCTYKPGKRVKYNIHRNCSSMMLVHWRTFHPYVLDGAGHA